MESRPDGGAPDAATFGGPADGDAGPQDLPPLGPPRPRDLIDFHAHFLPKAYVEQAKTAGQTPDGLPTWPTWSIDEHLALVDQAGIAVSVLSIPSPGVHFGNDAQARSLAALVNDEATALVGRLPASLRFLASLPLPDVAGAIAEWRRARSLPGCVGVTVLSHAGGSYLGDARFEPLWQELNGAPTLVLVHPTTPPDAAGLPADQPVLGMEYYFESVRACMSMFEARLVTRFPNLRFIIPHCGGALPSTLDRIRTFGIAGYTIDPGVTSAEAEGLWFDCAGAPLPSQLPALLQQAKLARVVYGSESVYTPFRAVLAQVAALDNASPPDATAPYRAALIENGRQLLQR